MSLTLFVCLVCVLCALAQEGSELRVWTISGFNVGASTCVQQMLLALKNLVGEPSAAAADAGADAPADDAAAAPAAGADDAAAPAPAADEGDSKDDS